MKSLFPKFFAVGASAITVSFALSFVILAWSEPSQLPPNSNVSPPLNTGPLVQSKAGNLSIGSGSPYWITKKGDSFTLKNNAGNIKFILGQDGNVGVGAVAPGQKLTVDGSFGILEGGVTPTYHTVFQGGNQSANLTYTLPANYPGANGYMLTSTTGGIMSWVAAGGSKWTTLGKNIYYNTGNVGVGTAAPAPYWAAAKALVVSDPVNNAALEVWGNNGAKSVFHSVNGNTYLGNYAKGTGSGNLYLGAGNFSWAISLLGSNGYAGIGTATPGARLEVAGQIKITGGTPGAGKVLTSDASGLATWAVPAESGGWTTLGKNIYASNSGNIGVGTANPAYKLDLRSGSVVSSFHLSPSGDDGLYFTSGGAANGVLAAGASYAGGYPLGQEKLRAKHAESWSVGGDEGWMALFVDSGLTVGTDFKPTPRLSLWSNGDINFGGTNAVDAPAIKMQKGIIKGQYSSGSGDVLWVGNDSKLVDINIANTAGIYGLQDSTTGSIKLGSNGGTITGYNGNIGIGTANPAVKLQVIGTASITGDIGITGQSTLVGNSYVGGDIKAPNNSHGSCYWTGWQQKYNLQTTFICSNGYYMAGTDFNHNSGENYTYQEYVRIYCCQL